MQSLRWSNRIKIFESFFQVIGDSMNNSDIVVNNGLPDTGITWQPRSHFS